MSNHLAMTDEGFGGAFRFVRSAVIGISTLVAARVHWALVALGLAAFVLMACQETRWQRAADRERGVMRLSAWWAGALVPLGLGVWASFLYLGLKTGTPRWIVWAGAYLSAVVLAGSLNVLGHDEGTLSTLSGLLCLGTWGAGLLRARMVCLGTWGAGLLHARMVCADMGPIPARS